MLPQLQTNRLEETTVPMIFSYHLGIKRKLFHDRKSGWSHFVVDTGFQNLHLSHIISTTKPGNITSHCATCSHLVLPYSPNMSSLHSGGYHLKYINDKIFLKNMKQEQSSMFIVHCPFVTIPQMIAAFRLLGLVLWLATSTTGGC